MQFEWEVVLAFIIYFVFVLLIGFYFYKKSSNISDYMLGGRQMNTYVTALSAQASDMSGWLLMGLPGALYLSGMSSAWIGIGLCVGTYLAWLFVAKRLRQYSYVAGDAITIPQFFENRFRDSKGLLRFISSIVILVFFTIYVASGFVAGGNVFISVFPGFNYQAALIIFMVIILVYTFMGGFKAVSWTDFFQGMLMIVVIVIVPLAATGALGGIDETVEAAKKISPTFLDLFKTTDGASVSATSVISDLAWGLGYLGMPHILVRFMAIKKPSMLKASRRIATVWVVIALFAAIAVGVVGRVYLGDIFTTDAQAQTVFMVMASRLFPPFVAGILLSAILAAVMSTADSQLLVASSAITNDLYGRFTKKKVPEKRLLWIGRMGVILIAVIAAVMAWDPNSSIMDLVQYAWAGFGASFGPVMILALFFKRTTKAGALAGMISGFVIVILWRNLFAASTGLYEMIPAFIIAFALTIIVSLAGKKPEKEIEEEFDKVKHSQA